MNIFRKVTDSVRLALFPIAYGLTGVFMGGTLNRVMIADLGLPASLAGFLFAIPLMVSPVRVWLGYRSDAYPVFGRRREPYMILGMLLTGIGVFAVTRIIIAFESSRAVLIGGAALAFIIYGFARNMGHNSFQALLADKFSEKARPRAVTAYEVATLTGFTAGAGFLGRALEVFEPARMVSVALGTAAAAFLFTLIAAPANEPRTPTSAAAAGYARSLSFGKTVRPILIGDPQVRLFFVLIILTFIGTLAQDVLLEPYGGLVLGMSVGDTTRLSIFWGLGVMGAMVLSGLILINRLGEMQVLRIGLVVSMLVFVGVITAGLAGRPGLFRALVLVMGIGTGLAGAGLLTCAINFTTAARAGILMAVWGVANQLGRALGSLMGGTVADLVLRASGGSTPAAYGTVFAIEAVLLLAALVLSFRFSDQESAAKRERPIPAPAA